MKKPFYYTPTTEMISFDLYKEGGVICASANAVIEAFNDEASDTDFNMFGNY